MGSSSPFTHSFFLFPLLSFFFFCCCCHFFDIFFVFFLSFFFVIFVVVFIVFFCLSFNILVEHILQQKIYITVNFSDVALVDLVLSGCRF